MFYFSLSSSHLASSNFLQLGGLCLKLRMRETSLTGDPRGQQGQCSPTLAGSGVERTSLAVTTNIPNCLGNPLGGPHFSPWSSISLPLRQGVYSETRAGLWPLDNHWLLLLSVPLLCAGKRMQATLLDQT